MLSLKEFVNKIWLGFFCNWTTTFDSYSFEVLVVYCYSWLSVIFLFKIAESPSLLPEGIFLLTHLEL